MRAPVRPLVIGTRASALARAQADLVADLLRRAHGDRLAVAVVTGDTEGDRTQAADVPLGDLAGRGVFVKDLERLLLDGTVDLLVHSMKDVTTDLAEGLAIVAVPPRADPRDALVARSGAPLAALPPGARVGTSSPRRAAQLAAVRRDLVFTAIRGNVDTRLRKLDAGDYDAVVLAAAGLQRLGLAHRITEYLDPEVCMPDPGQGALAVEARAGDGAVRALAAPLDDAASHAAVTAERAVLQALGGGCALPMGALAEVREGWLKLRAVACSPDGRRTLRRAVAGPATEAASLGQELAATLLAGGARGLLQEQRHG